MKLRVQGEVWPIDGVFRISRGAVTEVETILVEVEDEEGNVGRGEGSPVDHFRQSVPGSIAELERIRPDLLRNPSRLDLLDRLPAGAARNALDCALWDLEAKRAGKRAWELAGVEVEDLVTAYTISVDEPAAMRAQAGGSRDRPLLKIKLGGGDDVEQLRAVREAAPQSRIIVDANEAWDFGTLKSIAPEFASLGVELIEQPLPAAADGELADYRGPVPLCADESCLTRASLADVVGRYQFVNIKLDKTGGLTEALALAEEARAAGLRLMVGCMIGTSLAMAPGMVIGNLCEFVDLDGPLLLARDRTPGIEYLNSLMKVPPREVWG